MKIEVAPQLLPAGLEWRWTRWLGLTGVAMTAGAALVAAFHKPPAYAVALAGLAAVVLALAFRGRARHLEKLLVARLEDREQGRRAEEMSRAATSLAHEIRNTLTVLKGFVDLARRTAEDGSRPERVREHLAEVDAQVSRAIAEMQGILVLAASEEAGAARPIDDVIAEVVRLLKPLARMKDLTLATDVAVGLHRPVREPDLRRALLNLGLNAIDAARSEVLVRARSENDAVVVSVEDDGAGIAPAEQDRLFAPLSSGRSGGTGLGLAQVRRAVEAEGGTAHHEAVLPSGARFVLRLPASKGT